MIIMIIIMMIIIIIIIIIVCILVCSQKTGRKGLDAVKSSLCSRNYKTGGICRQERRPTNTGCQNTPT
jgi:uncharacterized membrane protein